MRLCRLVLLFVFALPLSVPAHASETPAEHAANVYAQQEMDAAPLHGNLPDYNLPQDKLVKAQHLQSVRITLHFLNTVWGIAQVLLLLWIGAIAWMRNKATTSTANLHARGKWVVAFVRECLVFSALLSAAIYLLNLPVKIYGHHLGLAYGLSVQGWPSWFIDQGKSFALGLGGNILIFGVMIALIRWLPRAWWIVCWAVAVPVSIFVIYVQPTVIDPMFDHFEALQKTQPELVARLEQIVQKGHMDIPPERMFLMQASAKVTTMNAYVTGFGGSKRVVVWDTSLNKGTTDEVLFIFGHESGHYVLGHILVGTLEGFAGLLLALYLGYLLLNWSIRRFGTRWKIPAARDWGAVGVLMLLFAVLSAVSEPIEETLTRQTEHAADVYGQEAIHGLVADPQATAKATFDLLGENALEEPNPSQFIELWTYSHPATGRRAAFGKAYNPWAPGVEPKYFPKEK